MGEVTKQEPTDRKFIEWLRDEHPVLHARWMTGPRIENADSRWTLLLPAAAEDVVTAYGALSTYLKILVQQPEEDLETIARVTRLLIAIKPQALEASQEIAGRKK